MPFAFYDSTGDTTTSTGVGPLIGTLTPPIGYQTPTAAGVVNNVQTVIRVETENGLFWEVCDSVVTLASGVYTYSRGSVIASSSAGSRVSFGPGVKRIYYTIDADHLASAVTNVVNEKPNGTIDNVNATFTTDFPFIPESVEVMLNGVVLSSPDDYYTVGSNTIQMMSSPVVGDKLLVNYTQLTNNI